MLRANWREGVHRDGTPFAYTCPATPRYRHQWHWDSCFHAIAWCRHDASARARSCARCCAAGAPTASSRTPCSGTATRAGAARRSTRRSACAAAATRRRSGRRCCPSRGSASPPPAPTSPGFATESLHALEAHLDWLERERDVDGDGLISILLPDESGLDDSPKYDPVYGRYAHYKPGYFRLVARYGRPGLERARRSRPSTTSTSRTCGSTSPTRSACARWRGSPATTRTRARADGVEAALLERCLDPATGLFFDLAGRAERPVRVSTWSSLSPLMLDTLPEDVRRRLVEEHLLDPRRYRAPFGIPSVAMDEPSFRPGFDLWRTWRGPSWMNVAWLLSPALRELGYDEDADRIAAGAGRGRRAATACASTTTRARARGLAARGFSWSALVADLASA